MQKLNVDEKTLICFKKFVLGKHGKIRGVLHQETENALEQYMKICGVHLPEKAIR